MGVSYWTHPRTDVSSQTQPRTDWSSHHKVRQTPPSRNTFHFSSRSILQRTDERKARSLSTVPTYSHILSNWQPRISFPHAFPLQPALLDCQGFLRSTPFFLSFFFRSRRSVPQNWLNPFLMAHKTGIGVRKKRGHDDGNWQPLKLLFVRLDLFRSGSRGSGRRPASSLVSPTTLTPALFLSFSGLRVQVRWAHPYTGHGSRITANLDGDFVKRNKPPLLLPCRPGAKASGLSLLPPVLSSFLWPFAHSGEQ